jgi:hypothetical protein
VKLKKMEEGEGRRMAKVEVEEDLRSKAQRVVKKE